MGSARNRLPGRARLTPCHLPPAGAFCKDARVKPRPALLLVLLVLASTAAPAAARESLGVFGAWAAFRDPATPRCHAIAMAQPSTMRRDFEPYASIGTWPRKNIRNQFYARLSRRTAPGKAVTLILGRERFRLSGTGGHAWAGDRRMDAAIVAGMRSSGGMIISATDERGNRFSNSYDLSGAATAMDAATLGCARLK